MCVMMCIHHFTSSCQYADEARSRKIKISSRKTVRRRKSENRKSVYVHSQFSINAQNELPLVSIDFLARFRQKADALPVVVVGLCVRSLAEEDVMVFVSRRLQPDFPHAESPLVFQVALAEHVDAVPHPTYFPSSIFFPLSFRS